MRGEDILSQTLSRAVEAGELAMQVQRSARSALNLATAEDIERLERRLRSISERVDEIEDRLDDLDAWRAASPSR